MASIILRQREPDVTRDEIVSEFQSTMRHIAAAVYAITTKHEGERFGIIATAFSSVSFDPPSVLVCVNQDTSIHKPLSICDHFAVNVLGLNNRDVADCFAMKKGEERFAVGDWTEVEGVPVLASAQSSLVCEVADRHVFGTHTIYIGKIISANHRDNAKPLIYYDRRYIDISASPDQPTG
jgi:flavin reductase